MRTRGHISLSDSLEAMETVETGTKQEATEEVVKCQLQDIQENSNNNNIALTRITLK